MITFTKEQLSEVMCKHAAKENGLHDLLEIMTVTFHKNGVQFSIFQG